MFGESDFGAAFEFKSTGLRQGFFLWYNSIKCNKFGKRQIVLCPGRSSHSIEVDGCKMMHDKYNENVEDKGRILHGAIYHMLWDRPLSSTRKKVADLIPSGSSVIDIACGTGEFCFELAAQKNCYVLGIDLSPRMIKFARKRNRYDTVRFESCDATDLADFGISEFDFATILLLLHEVTRPVQVAAVKEALRVAKKTIIVESLAPLPKNVHGMSLHIVEAIGGLRHYRSFTDFLKTGGISGILGDSSIAATITHRCVFWSGCREMVVLENQN